MWVSTARTPYLFSFPLSSTFVPHRSFYLPAPIHLLPPSLALPPSCLPCLLRAEVCREPGVAELGAGTPEFGSARPHRCCNQWKHHRARQRSRGAAMEIVKAVHRCCDEATARRRCYTTAAMKHRSGRCEMRRDAGDGAPLRRHRSCNEAL